MPRYDYKCDTCRKKYELQQSFSAEASHVCEKCGKGTATRMLSVPTVVFKGSGFYVTDKGGKGSKMSDSDVTGSDKSSPDKKSEKSDSKSKSASKSESKSKSTASDAAAS